MLVATAGSAKAGSDRLFVGDGSDNNVEVFNAQNGNYLRTFPTASAPVVGPRGVLYSGGQLLLANQNVNTPFNGEVLRFNGTTGAEVLPPLVAGTRADAPFAPRGMVRWNNKFYVANVCNPCSPDDPGGGGVLVYTSTGVYLKTLSPPPGPVQFHPFGVVIGPDGLLYVTSRPNLFSSDLGGRVLQFDPATGKYLKTFIANVGGPGKLNSPEGIVFGPDGKLYVTSLRADASDTDKILVYQGPSGAKPGTRVGKIDLDKAGGPNPKRSTAQALLFGPGGDLFVPITNAFTDGSTPGDTGAVRRYKVACRQTATNPCFSNFVRPGGQLGQGWYLTFGKTNPGTLAYGG
ncbi:MAG: hypothetical protein U1E45_10410 [Geminicoccaceae bacterium]